MQKNIRNLVLCMLVLSVTSGLSIAQEPEYAITLEALDIHKLLGDQHDE